MLQRKLFLASRAYYSPTGLLAQTMLVVPTGLTPIEPGTLSRNVIRCIRPGSVTVGDQKITCDNSSMCGRYVRRSDKQRTVEHFRIDPTTLPDLGVSYNIAHQTFQPIVRLNCDSGARETVIMRWGLVPF
jgi:hypothetical protein